MRRILIISATLCLVLLVVELGSYGLLSYVQGGFHIPGTVSESVAGGIPGINRLTGNQTRHANPGIEDTCIHPYLGYVLKPTWDKTEKTEPHKKTEPHRKRKSNLKITQSKSGFSRPGNEGEIWYQSYKILPDMGKWNERENEGMFGFPETRVFHERKSSRVIVGVLGGSFAQEFSNSALMHLLNLLLNFRRV